MSDATIGLSDEAAAQLEAIHDAQRRCGIASANAARAARDFGQAVWVLEQLTEGFLKAHPEICVKIPAEP